MHFPSVEQLIRGAELETGQSDWNTEFTGSPLTALRLLVADVASSSHLSELGVQRIYRRLHETLCARLNYIADRKRYPEIANEPIEAPIFILGLPRSGTTFLHNLLASDPVNRAPRLYEMVIPAPKNPEPLDQWLRERRCHEMLQFLGMLDDDWLAVHPMGADRAEECVFVWELFLLSPVYSAMVDVPNYLDFLFKSDFTALYREQRAFMQYLQHREGRRRWVLKTPIHVRFLKEIIEVFPDARFIHCHRDTAKIYPSIAKMAAVLYSKHSDQPPGDGAIANDYDGTWTEALEFRRRTGMAERFVDVKFLEFQADPLGTAERIYTALGFDFSAERAKAMEGWLGQDRAQRSSRKHHHYSLEETGMSVAEIDRKTGDYLKAFDVPLER
jgi:hypothetical protein